MFDECVFQMDRFVLSRHEVNGVYVHPSHYHNDSSYRDVSTALCSWCNIRLEGESILLPMHEPDYWAFIHEYLHAIFQHLNQDAKNELIAATIKCGQYENMKKLTNMQGEAPSLVESMQLEIDELIMRNSGNRFAKEVQNYADENYIFKNFDMLYQLKIPW